MARSCSQAIQWNQLDTELYMQFRYSNKSSGSPFRAKGKVQQPARARNNFPPGTCWKFHAGKTCNGCSFQHACFECNGFHPIFKCRNQRNRYSTPSGNRYETSFSRNPEQPASPAQRQAEQQQLNNARPTPRPLARANNSVAATRPANPR